MQKKRGANEGTIFKLPDGRWRGMVNLGYRNGKRWRKSIEALTRQEVQQRLTTALRDSQLGLNIAPERQSVGHFLNYWLAAVVKPSVKPKTHRTYSDLCRLHLIPGLGKQSLTQLSAQSIQAFLNEKLNYVACPHCGQRLPVGDFDNHQMGRHSDKSVKTRNPTLSARTIKHLLVTLRTALNVAIRWDLVAR